MQCTVEVLHHLKNWVRFYIKQKWRNESLWWCSQDTIGNGLEMLIRYNYLWKRSKWNHSSLHVFSSLEILNFLLWMTWMLLARYSFIHFKRKENWQCKLNNFIKVRLKVLFSNAQQVTRRFKKIYIKKEEGSWKRGLRRM